MDLLIRQAQVSDAVPIAGLNRQLGYDVATDAIRCRLATVLERPDHRFWVAEHDVTVIGWVHAVIFQFIEADPFVAIGGLVVDRDHRRRGAGRLLMHRAEEWARDEGCAIVRLWSSAARTGAHRFYERLGYTNIKTQYSFARNLDPADAGWFRGFVPVVEDQEDS
jgi:GNAT superfamily N-acetyltransferase